MEAYLQQSHQTKFNRFPKIFESAKRLQPDAKRILSFGCSTGEEAMTLAELFPEAEIVGVDIDMSSVNTARKNNKHPKRAFFHDCLGGTGSYDICTCLMVLFSLETPVAIDKANKILTEINNHINPGGILMLYTCDHNPLLCEDISGNYEILNEWTRCHDKKPDKQYFCGYYKKISRIRWDNL